MSSTASLWLTCDGLYDQFGGGHFKVAEDKRQWNDWDTQTQGEKPGYWKVAETEEELGQQWRQKYSELVIKCGGRLCPWNMRKSRMISARWQFKMKNPLKIRAIFAGIYDWNRDEARVVAKCIRLMEMTVDTDDFSVDSCLVVANELKIIEEELMMVYGKETKLKVRGPTSKTICGVIPKRQ